MEEGAVGLTQFLTLIGRPVSLAGLAVGLIAAVRLVPRGSAPDLSGSGLVERIAVGLCGGVAMLGLLGTIQTVFPRMPDFAPLSTLFAVAIILCGSPAVAWKSRWRGVAEGVATMSIATATLLTGFSIGFLFVPLVILMIWVCLRRLWVRQVQVRTETGSENAK
jgi:hypothetical protein